MKGSLLCVTIFFTKDTCIIIPGVLISTDLLLATAHSLSTAHASAVDN